MKTILANCVLVQFKQNCHFALVCFLFVSEQSGSDRREKKARSKLGQTSFASLRFGFNLISFVLFLFRALQVAHKETNKGPPRALLGLLSLFPPRGSNEGANRVQDWLARVEYPTLTMVVEVEVGVTFIDWILVATTTQTSPQSRE